MIMIMLIFALKCVNVEMREDERRHERGEGHKQPLKDEDFGLNQIDLNLLFSSFIVLCCFYILHANFSGKHQA